ncbi:MAG: hypothetical protein PF542_05430 [Nanoarchaeota archaeon]|jgi:hypothetical protein|nr:hypothetical protein [Nanoarchaeota archaeon]
MTKKASRRSSSESRFTVYLTVKEVALLKKMGKEKRMSAQQIKKLGRFEEVKGLMSKGVFRKEKKVHIEDPQYYTLTVSGRKNL